MKMKKIGIVFIVCIMAFCGCNHQNDSLIDDANSGNYSSADDYTNEESGGTGDNIGDFEGDYRGFALE